LDIKWTDLSLEKGVKSGRKIIKGQRKQADKDSLCLNESKIDLCCPRGIKRKHPKRW
jgi:hypothetical protein